ncbi:MAG: sulfatase-like hydrolase/transferase [Bryobacterales bacterium]|nr:sulfatase-like hydrolase/transferase [Bryobacterales bacterium]
MQRRQLIGGMAAAGALATTGLSGRAAQPRRRPNIVFMMADDMGYADLGCYGSRDIRTPAIDSIARDGLRFTGCYSNAAVCTPTRVGFLTGCYQHRFGKDLEWALGPANNKTAGLLPKDTVLPGALKQAGYRCGMFGKWHVGWRPESRPGRHGFDEWLGILLGNVDMYTHRYHDGSRDLWENDQPVERQGYLTELLADGAVRFVENNANQPFFLYVPFNAVHWPFQPPGKPEQIATSENWRDGTRADYIAMTESMDTAVGRVLDALRRKGVDDNTLVVFTNDNGGERLSESGPLFHTKGTLFEGGIRVPALLRWPGVAPAGAVTGQVCATMDFTATFLAAAGVAPPDKRLLDGRDLTPALRQPGRPFPRALFWRAELNGRRQMAMRYERWKYLDDNTGERGLPELLFDVEADPGERRNLFYSNQEVAARMRRQCLEWHKDVARGVVYA